MDLETQVRRHKEISLLVAELEKEKKALGALIMSQMKGKQDLVADFILRKIERYSFAVTLEEARKHDATKMEETLDKDKIKRLVNAGNKIEGVSQYQYVTVTPVKPATPQPEG